MSVGGGRVADPHPADRHLQQLHEAVVGRPLDEDARPGAAVLPALSNTAIGAEAAARSRSASAKTMLALLPPSSRVRRFMGRTAGHDPLADLGRAGEDDLAHVGVVDQALAGDPPSPGTTWNTSSGNPASSEGGQAQGGQGREAGRLEHHRVAGRAGAKPPRRSAWGSSRGRSPRRRRWARGRSRRARPAPGSGGRRVAREPPRSSGGRRGRCRPPIGRCRSCAELATPARPGGRRRRPPPRRTGAAGAPDRRGPPPARPGMRPWHGRWPRRWRKPRCGGPPRPPLRWRG